MVNQSTDYSSTCTNGTNRPFVFARLTSVMRCSLQMVYRSTEELTIRSNGRNRKASLTNRNLLPMVRLVSVF